MHAQNKAEWIVNKLLEAEQIRVCADCEQEFGKVFAEPGQGKTHGLCRRHAMKMAHVVGDPHFIRTMQAHSDNDFCPDLKEHPEMLQQQRYQTPPAGDWMGRSSAG